MNISYTLNHLVDSNGGKCRVTNNGTTNRQPPTAINAANATAFTNIPSIAHGNGAATCARSQMPEAKLPKRVVVDNTNGSSKVKHGTEQKQNVSKHLSPKKHEYHFRAGTLSLMHQNAISHQSAACRREGEDVSEVVV
jgi:hypothetical protein